MGNCPGLNPREQARIPESFLSGLANCNLAGNRLQLINEIVSVVPLDKQPPHFIMVPQINVCS